MESPASSSFSPLSSPPPSSSLLPPIPRRPSRDYHPARALPFELASHITIYFEEELYTQAFALLLSLLSSSAHAHLVQPTYVPSPVHLALASTLTVHPALTTATVNQDEWSQADSAIQLLRVVGQVVGPVNADLVRALKFSRYKFGRTKTKSGIARRQNGYKEKVGDGLELDGTKIMCRYAQQENLYACADDFWHVAGWAFNCSRLHAKRWSRWALWLDWMIGILEDDWQCRVPDGGMESSVIWSYMTQSSFGHSRNRRILRSIFANGSNKAINEFGPVFRNETREPKMQQVDILKRREVDVNVDAEVYGDYMVGEDEDEASDEEQKKTAPAFFTRSTRTRDPSLRRVKSRPSMTSLNGTGSEADDVGTDGPGYLGGSDSLKLRMRLLQLLSEVSVKLPHAFENGAELYTMFVEFIRPLPLPTFQAMVSPSAVPSLFSTDAQTTLCEFLLTRSLLEAAAPPSDEPYLRQSKLEQCYLPFAATSCSVVDNAKVSLCLESLLRHLWLAGKLTPRPELDTVIHKGIQKRCGKASERGKKSASAKRRDETAWTSLFESCERLAEICRRVQSSEVK